MVVTAARLVVVFLYPDVAARLPSSWVVCIHFTLPLPYDNKAPATCTSPKTYRGLKPGRHRFSVAATDPAGNTDPTPAARTFTVVAPQTTLRAGPQKNTRSGSATFRFTANQKGAGFRCRLDNGRAVRCVSPKRYNHLRNGRHTFTVYAVNPSGLRDSSPAERTWTVK